MHEGTPGHAIEVFLTWGTGAAASVLAVAYVRGGERFSLDEVVRPGAAREVVLWNDAPCVAPPRGAKVWIDGRPSPAERTRLRPGEVVEVSWGELTLRSRLVSPEPWEVPADPDRASSLPRGLALSVLVHVGCFLLLAFALSPRAGDADITPEQLVTMRTLLAASTERVPPDARVERSAVERAARHEATSGWHSTPGAPQRAASEAPSRSEAPVGPAAVPAVGSSSPSRAAERAEAAGFGMVGLVQGLKIDPNEPAPWKDALASLGAHEAATREMFGDPPIEKAGIGGLTLSGTGLGGGGKADGVYLGGPEPESGAWRPPAWSKRIEELPPVPDHPLPGRGSAGPLRTPGEMLADAGLSQAAIRGVIRANAGRVRECYETGLRRNPALAGRVVVGFTIGEGGAVVYAKDEGSDLPDPAVRDCIVKAFYSLGFPAPKGGQVTVKYPFALKPGE